MTSNATPFQLGDPVTHRGIVVAPLFPRSTHERATSRSTRRFLAAS